MGALLHHRAPATPFRFIRVIITANLFASSFSFRWRHSILVVSDSALRNLMARR